MMDEIEMDRQKALQGWDRQSCAEFDQFLDDWHAEQERDSAEPPCTCYYTDVDVVENRYCEAHGRF